LFEKQKRDEKGGDEMIHQYSPELLNKYSLKNE
jgi:hypothetical protein